MRAHFASLMAPLEVSSHIPAQEVKNVEPLHKCVQRKWEREIIAIVPACGFNRERIWWEVGEVGMRETI